MAIRTVNAQGIGAHHVAHGTGILGRDGLARQLMPILIVSDDSQDRPVAPPQQTPRPKQVNKTNGTDDIVPAAT